jgi:hypothetical protein
VAEISHVRRGVPEQASLGRALREGGAQLFPQWLAAEFAAEPRILWWGIRGAPLELLELAADGPTAGLQPRPFDDWTEPPRGLILATLDTERAARDLAPALGSDWHDAGTDALLDARCRSLVLGRSRLVLAEPAGEGYIAACLARFGEGPVAFALDGWSDAGRRATTNPVSPGAATYLRLGPRTAPTAIFLRARG